MSYILGMRNNSDVKSEDYIVVNNCGCYKNLECTYYTCRPKGRSDYQLIYIKKGSGVFVFDGEKTVLSEGSLIMYKPYEPQNYTYYADMADHESYWIHFNGNGVEDILRSADLWDKRIHLIGIVSEICELILKMIKEIQLANKNYDVINIGYFLQVITIISRLKEKSPNLRNKNLARLEAVIDDMYQNPHSCRTADDYAQMCYLSTSRFTHMFKECFGVSPMAYKKKIRIEQAKFFLKDTSLSIKEISERVGFGDSLYFSRIFKQSTGYSPKEYAKLK